MKIWSMMKRCKAGIYISLCLSFLLTIYAPLEMFFYNIDDFWFNFTLMFPVCLILFLVLWMAGSLAFILLGAVNKYIYNVGIAVGFVTLICTYVQGTFLISNLPPMDGTNIDWGEYRAENVKTIILWVLILAACLVIIKFAKISLFNKIAGKVSCYLFLILLFSIFISGIATSGYKDKDLLTATNRYEFEFSEDTNFIILILDAVDAGTVSQILETDEESREVFTDFTYYENVLCAYPFTKFSMPFIMSGKWYTNEKPPRDYFEESIDESPLINTIEEQYKMELFSNSIAIVNEENSERFANMVSDHSYISSYKQFVKGMIKLAGIKYAPYPAKKICYNVLEQLEGARGIGEEVEDDQIFSGNNRRFCQRIEENEIAYTSDKVFKLIHLEGAHVPYRYNKNVEVIEDGTYLGNVEASITTASRFLDKLKESNVYDNSVIIIMADHGYNIVGLRGRQNPILFIKGIGEHHEMNVSNAPISYDDLQDAYQLLLKGESGDAVFPWEENQKRQRRYLLYVYEEEETMYEYMTEGHAAETEELQPTGKEFVRAH